MVNALKWLLICLVLLGLAGGGIAYGEHLINVRKAQDNAVAAEKRSDISITIIEGKRREEIAAQLQAAGIVSAPDFLAATTADEGTLFPDTYRFFPDTPAADVVAKMEDNYQTRVASDPPTQDQLILASIVEREANTDAQRPIIAAVYENRLAIGMRLQSDPTVQYAKDTLAYAADPSTSFVFWKPITAADYTSVQSPFSTYGNTGLPPAPICDPGLASITAAENPATIDPGYIYFVVKNGQLLLAKTLAEHNVQAAE